MPHPMRFSVLVLPNVPWPELLRRCQAGGRSRLRLRSALPITSPTGPAATVRGSSCGRKLAAVAMATRAHPPRKRWWHKFRCATRAMFALQALTADHISAGRLDVGLGTGLEIDPSYRMIGIENWPAKPERVARFGEYVETRRIACCAATKPPATAASTAPIAAALRPLPVQSPRPPLILIAAMGPRDAASSPRATPISGTASASPGPSTAQLAETQPAHRQGRRTLCTAIGRDPASLRRSYLMFDPTARSSGGVIQYYQSEEQFVRDMVQRCARPRHQRNRRSTTRCWTASAPCSPGSLATCCPA